MGGGSGDGTQENLIRLIYRGPAIGFYRFGKFEDFATKEIPAFLRNEGLPDKLRKERNALIYNYLENEVKLSYLRMQNDRIEVYLSAKTTPSIREDKIISEILNNIESLIFQEEKK